MSGISKEKWEEIEQVLRAFNVDVRFTYKGHKLTIQRVTVGEGKMSLAVFIDGRIKASWGVPDNDKPAIIPDVWKLRTQNRYPPRAVKKLEKVFGKRKAKQMYPDLHDKHTVYIPTFSKASVLCRQFKKLDGLMLSDDSTEIPLSISA